MVFLTIYQYFTLKDVGVKRLQSENLFKMKTQMDDVDRLEKHISLGNYKFMFSVENPHVVATFLKSILKCMSEPLCKYSLYEKFKFLAKGLSTNHLKDSLAKNIFISDL